MTKENEKKTILIVDDAPDIVSILCMVLDEEGYKTVVAINGEEGWNKYRECKPDLILLDINLPYLSGIDLLRHIRKKDTLTSIIMISGYASLDNAIESFRLGADDYIIKPFSVQSILVAIDNAFNKSITEREIHRLELQVSVLSEENKYLAKEVFKSSQDDAINNTGSDRYREMCGSVTHSLKNEFMHIGNATKYIRDLADNSSEILEECDMIERSVGYSQILLRRLLDYLDMGIPQVEPINVSELLKKVEIMVLPRLPSNINLNITANDDANKLRISTNPEQLMGVLIELTQNAGNAMRNNGGIININAKKDDSHVIISVIDNGAGIPKELKEKLLKDQVPSKKGLGLGLFLSNKVIGMLGGSMNLESSSDEGTAITISLPVASEEGGE